MGKKPDCTVTRTKEALRTEGKCQGKGTSEARDCYDCGGQEHVGVNCPYKWTNSTDEEDDQGSSLESDLEGENAEELASLMTRESGAGPEGTESPDGESEWTQGQHVTTLAEDENEQVSGGLNHLVQQKAEGAQWTWEKVTVGSRLGCGGARDAEKHVPRNILPKQPRGPSMEKGSKDQARDPIKNYGQQVMSVSTPEGFVRKSTWQVADEKTSRVSISHHPTREGLVHREG